jgi:hypothetical protein
MATDPLLDISNRALVSLGAKKIGSLDEGTDRAIACKLEAEHTRTAVLRAHPWNFARKRARLVTYPQATLQPGAGADTPSTPSAPTPGVTFHASAQGAFLTTGQDVGARIIANHGLARITSVVDDQNVVAQIEVPFADLSVIAVAGWRTTVGWEWDFRYNKPADYIRLFEMQGLAIKGIGSSVLWTWWRDLNNAPEPIKVEDQFLVSNIGGLVDIAYTADIPDLTLWDPLAHDALSAKLAVNICNAVTGSSQQVKMATEMFKGAISEARTMNGQEGTADDSGSDILLAVRMM